MKTLKSLVETAIREPSKEFGYHVMYDIDTVKEENLVKTEKHSVTPALERYKFNLQVEEVSKRLMEFIKKHTGILFDDKHFFSLEVNRGEVTCRIYKM